MKRFAYIAVATPLALAGCGGQTSVTGNAISCGEALLAAGTSSPTTLFSVAMATPACASLASEVIQAIIADVSKKQLARGIRQ